MKPENKRNLIKLSLQLIDELVHQQNIKCYEDFKGDTVKKMAQELEYFNVIESVGQENLTQINRSIRKYVKYSDEQINDIIWNYLQSQEIEIDKNVLDFDPCNDINDAWKILETFDCTMDISGTAKVSKMPIKVTIKTQVNKAAMIAFIVFKEQESMNQI